MLRNGALAERNTGSVDISRWICEQRKGRNSILLAGKGQME
ncbi:MAG: hypothetical protein ACYS76_03725 [Planctomycetota bacterium]